MGDTTKIEWTDATWNPVTGCTKVSPGCDHCYAEGIANRFAGGAAWPNGFDVTLREKRLTEPFRWHEPKRVFVNSMSDLFHEAISDDYIARVFAVMAATPQHTYQILTKRHARLRAYLRDSCRCGTGHPPMTHLLSRVAWAVSRANPERIPGDFDEEALRAVTWPLPNVWLGVSVEDQQWANVRVPALLETPAAVRFLSCEPLLGPVSLAGAVDGTCWWCRGSGYLGGRNWVAQSDVEPNCWHCNGQGLDGRRVNWVIVGGESGAGARPMDPDWVRTLRSQCEATLTPFFFKQWGSHDESGKRMSKAAAGRLLDGRTYDGYPVAS